MAKKKRNPISEQNKDTVINKSLENVIHDSIMPYAEYVILERALPRVEDGLKPVQRRILYTMHELGLSPDKPHKKSARIVGDALGKYHPHGDTSIYDAMVRMAQDFNMRNPLVDGHGNFGSIDGDTAAAMRYTETRMTPLALQLLKDIDKETIKFNLNFDDTLKEPEVLPGRFPNLLVNGSTGIAIGLATNIPPHNLSEVIDGAIELMTKNDVSIDRLMEIIKGPDFPTGGYVIGKDEIKQAYRTGKGRLIIRAKVETEKIRGGREQLVITELPYQVNKSVLLERILRISEERKGVLTGISDIRDESDREGIRAVIELKKDADSKKILNYLYKYSDLQTTFGVNMVAIAEGKPQQLGLKQILEHYIKHQKDVVTRRTKYEYDKAKAREHILEGLMIAVSNIDKVIAIIRASKNTKDARINLINEFKLSEVQAQAILDMRLQKLTNLEIVNLEKEYTKIKKLIKQLKAILESEELLIKVIKDELLDIKERFANERRTKIISDSSKAEIREDDIIHIEDCVVTLTKNQEIKSIPIKSFNRSSRDVEVVETRDMNYIEFLVDSATNHRILLFTDRGNCYGITCKEIPEGKWREKGIHLSLLINNFDRSEKVISLVSVKNFEEDANITFFSEKGMVKKTKLKEYNTRVTKILACGLRDGDSIMHAEVTKGQEDNIIVTEMGMCIRFSGSQVNAMGRTAMGVKAIQLKKHDKVIFAQHVDDSGELIVITDRGFAKRSLLVDYEKQGRGGTGFRTITFPRDKINGKRLVSAFYTKDPYEIILLQKDGNITRLDTGGLEIQTRAAKGESVVLVVMDNEVVTSYRNYN